MLRKHYPDHYNCKQQSRAGTETERHRQIDRQTVWDRDRQTDRQTESSLFTRVINKRYAFLHPALAQTRGYSKSNYTCTHFLSYDTPVHTWNKWSADVKHDMGQAGMGVDRWGFQIIISKHYLVINGRHNMVERCRRVTITKYNMQWQPVSA